MEVKLVMLILVALMLIEARSTSHAAHSFPSPLPNLVADTDTLQLVQVIFRHGDRAPTNSYPLDPVNKNPTAWPEGHAQLTSIGKMQQYHLGQYLRRRYNGFLADKYHSEEIYVVSSDMDRTIMSVESNLAGLFPPVGHRWHPHLDWTPVPLRTIPWKEDKYLHVNIKCPKYEQLHHEFLQNSQVVLDINQENKDFVAHLSQQSGIRASTVKEIISLQDIILTESIHNFTVPQWAIDALPRLNALQAEVNTWSTYTDPMKRLHGGPLLQLLIKNMLAKSGALHFSTPEEKVEMVVGGGNRKMLLYSAHDSTLARIMNTMGVFHPHNPPYASAFMLELHWDDVHTDHYVKVFYRNETDRAPYELEIPNCAGPCFLANLVSATEHLIPRDLKRECSLDDEEEEGEKGSPPSLLRMMPPPTGFNDDPSHPQQKTGPSMTCSVNHYPTTNPWVLGGVGMILVLVCILLWACLLRVFGWECRRISPNSTNHWSSTKMKNNYPWRSRGYGYEQI